MEIRIGCKYNEKRPFFLTIKGLRLLICGEILLSIFMLYRHLSGLPVMQTKLNIAHSFIVVKIRLCMTTIQLKTATTDGKALTGEICS